MANKIYHGRFAAFEIQPEVTTLAAIERDAAR